MSHSRSRPKSPREKRFRELRMGPREVIFFASRSLLTYLGGQRTGGFLCYDKNRHEITNIKGF